MSAVVAGITVATPSDLRSLERSLSDAINRVAEQARRQSEEHLAVMRILRSDLTSQASRLGRIEASIDAMEEVLVDVGTEMEQGAKLLGNVLVHADDSRKTLDKIAAAARDQVKMEADRRHELVAHLQQLLASYDQQTAAVRQAFADVQADLDALAKSEQESGQRITEAVGELGNVLNDVARQAEGGLQDIATAIDDMARHKAKQALCESELLEALVASQSGSLDRLQELRSSAERLAGSSLETKATHESVLAMSNAQRLRALSAEGISLLQRHHYQASIAPMEAALELAPDDQLLRTHLALAYLRSGRSDHARRLLLQTLESDAECAPALHLLGILHLEQGDPEAATSVLQKAAEISARDAPVWLDLGRAYYDVGAIASALHAWERARELDPAMANDNTLVRVMLEEQGRVDDLRLEVACLPVR